MIAPALENCWRDGTGLVLIGYRGTGKSTVGRIVAERTQAPFADADTVLEHAAGQSIRSIFEAEGEDGFRRREAAILLHLTAASPELTGGILSTGGGAILQETNRRAFRQFGLVVWLTADHDTLARRLARSQHASADRPPLTAEGTLEEVATVLAARTPIYREAADVEVVSAGRSVHEVADSVIEAWYRALLERRCRRWKEANR